jgi:hypothetical protein
MEAKELRIGNWYDHNVFGLCVRFLPTRMFKVTDNVKGKK